MNIVDLAARARAKQQEPKYYCKIHGTVDCNANFGFQHDPRLNFSVCMLCVREFVFKHIGVLTVK
jgi:hypothetical protein